MKYDIVLTILGQQYKTSGESILDALSKFNFDWHEIKGKGVMNITCGDKKHEHLYNRPTLVRMFTNKIALQTQAKNLKTLLK